MVYVELISLNLAIAKSIFLSCILKIYLQWIKMFNNSFPVVNKMSLSHCFLLLLYCEKMSTLDLQWLFILLSIKVISLSIAVSRATCYHYFWRPAVQKWEVPIFYHLTDTLKSSTIAFLILFKVSRHISGCVTIYYHLT